MISIQPQLIGILAISAAALAPIGASEARTLEECTPTAVNQFLSSCTCGGQGCTVFLTVNDASGPSCNDCTFSVITTVTCTSPISSCRDINSTTTVGLVCQHFVTSEEVVETFCHDSTTAVKTTLRCNKCL